SPQRNRAAPSQVEGEGISARVHARSHVLALRATSGNREGSKVVRRAREPDQSLFLEEMKRPGNNEAMERRPKGAVGEVGDGARERTDPRRADSTQGASERLRTEFGRSDRGGHPKQRGDRIPRSKERPVLPQVQQDERMESGATILQDRLERARRHETGGGERDGRRAAELVCLETERARRRRQNGNSVDDPRTNLRRLRPEAEIDVSRGRHRTAGNQERDCPACRGGEEDLAVLHLFAAESMDLAVDQLFHCIDRGAWQRLRVELGEYQAGSAGLVKSAKGEPPR